MLDNWKLQISGNKVILVPYTDKHVLKYHGWMQNENLQHLTGSEPLSLEEEYDMQKTWKESPDKCTFIVLSKEILEKTDENEIDSMIGDTNLFIQKLETEEKDEFVAEVEIMIAEKVERGKKLGYEALCLMINYGISQLNIKKFEAKIKCDNEPSIKLFEKLGFVESKRSEVFNEITYILTSSEFNKYEEQISAILLHTTTSEYRHN